jgi:hypothetical protein
VDSWPSENTVHPLVLFICVNCSSTGTVHAQSAIFYCWYCSLVALFIAKATLGTVSVGVVHQESDVWTFFDRLIVNLAEKNVARDEQCRATWALLGLQIAQATFVFNCAS